MASIAASPAGSRDEYELALLHRLRRAAEPSAAVAATIEVFCDSSAQLLDDARAELEGETMAWLVLCDRGWPSDCRPDPAMLSAAGAWMAVWRDVVAEPVSATTATPTADRAHVAALGQCEAVLSRVLPSVVWQLVTPLDATGRATLASLLQALAAWATSRALALRAAQQTVHVRERVARMAAEVQSVGHAAPADLLDVEAWRALAAALRSDVRLLPRDGARRSGPETT